MYEYLTTGVCSKNIRFEVENNILKNVAFTGGCNGNLKAISILVEGMEVDKVIELLSGVNCGPRDTSCADQLTKALIQFKNK
ncbi:TIGR03905 family TSCPD domain-containing protein [Proteiniborus sp. MB09-C3]|uniref:TIGR03905 family TSCPD domain-containing protein n=1 Tax=Proteiniborus sp. MB09-C3 TaxID=3050072 RepID=UPI002553ADAD|nr:TIGR03905 family TSCPD domain-containing protein [Proteiniborus sp. MB09-C3]WIV13480.1 TIGR03905 family TSCPD domain-containing protein [Proteiniborus sp. MB09-C3]